MKQAAAKEPGATELFGRCTNWGRWGADDERGTLNFIDASVVRRAVATVSFGEVVALGRLIVPKPSGGAGAAPPEAQLHVYQGPEARDALDTQVISPHGFSITHLDAVGHSFYEGHGYSGRAMDEVVRPEGLSFGGIEAMAGGILARGVFLDVAASRGDVPCDVDGSITAVDLDEAQEAAGVIVAPGDAVFVRAGILPGPPDREGRRGGLVGSAVLWLREHEVSLYAGDCIERLPGVDAGLPMVLHQVGHVAMGLAILDNPDVESLRSACSRHGRNVFLLVVAPVAVRGATGCAVNPLAVF